MAADDSTSPEHQRELDDTLRSLKDLITDPTQAQSGPGEESNHPDEDVPTLTNVVHDPDDVQRDIFEQIAFDKGVLNKSIRKDPAPTEAPLRINDPAPSRSPSTTTTTAQSESPSSPAPSNSIPDSTAQSEASSEADSKLDPKLGDQDFAAAADRFAEENFSSGQSDKIIPQNSLPTNQSADDGIPVIDDAIDADEVFPDGAFDGPELDDYAGDTLPGGFLPGSVDNRPYEEFGLDELPGDDGDDAADLPAAGGVATIWDDRRPDSFVRTADDVATDAVGLVKNSLNAAGEKPLHPEIASEIQKALAGMLEQWHEADADEPATPESGDTPK